MLDMDSETPCMDRPPDAPIHPRQSVAHRRRRQRFDTHIDAVGAVCRTTCRAPLLSPPVMSTLFARSLARQATHAIARRVVNAPARGIMTLKDHKYTAHATASGQGRNGQVTSDDDCGLQLRLAMPRSLGGKGDGQNPEQLFAMGYAACFLSAMQLVAGQTGKSEMAKNATVHTQIHMGQPEGMDGYGLEVDIQVEGVDDMELIEAGHKACPYSRALAKGVVVNVSKK
ncbi:OsmC/Ohr family [Cerioporus squamosus]|nr:OsmC/Ohr family [Cerioporus squamosus]